MPPYFPPQSPFPPLPSPPFGKGPFWRSFSFSCLSRLVTNSRPVSLFLRLLTECRFFDPFVFKGGASFWGSLSGDPPPLPHLPQDLFLSSAFPLFSLFLHPLPDATNFATKLPPPKTLDGLSPPPTPSLLKVVFAILNPGLPLSFSVFF